MAQATNTKVNELFNAAVAHQSAQVTPVAFKNSYP